MMVEKLQKNNLENRAVYIFGVKFVGRTNACRSPETPLIRA